MADKELDKELELARARAKAKLKLQQQEEDFQYKLDMASQAENRTPTQTQLLQNKALQTLATVSDYGPGLTRTFIEGASQAFEPSENQTFQKADIVKALLGKAPDYAEYTRRAGKEPGVSEELMQLVSDPFLIGGGELLSMGVKGLKETAKSGARAAARFSPEMAETYLRNRPAVEKWRNLFQNRAAMSDKATDVLAKNLATLEERGISQYEADILSKLQDKYLTIPEKDLQFMAEMGDKGAQEYLIISAKNREAMRPITKDVIGSNAIQQGLEIKPTNEIVSSDINRIPGTTPQQESLFSDVGGISHITKKDVQQIDPDLFGLSKSEAQMADTAGQLRNAYQQQVLQDQLSEKIPANIKQIPGLDETKVDFIKQLSDQGILDLPMGGPPKGMVKLPAEEVQRLKIKAQRASEFEPMGVTSIEAGLAAKAKNEAAEEVAYRLQRAIEGLDESIRPTNSILAKGKELQKAIKKGINSPIATLKSATDDNLAAMERIAERVGDPGLMLENRSFRTAKQMSPVDIDDAIERGIERKLGRGALQGIDFLESIGANVAPYSEKIMPYKPTVWLKMFRNKENENGQE